MKSWGNAEADPQHFIKKGDEKFLTVLESATKN
jgi:hypothetical protein